MSPRRARKKAKGSILGRTLELLANLLLFLVILAFGISIATHILKEERAAGTDTTRRGYTQSSVKPGATETSRSNVAGLSSGVSAASRDADEAGSQGARGRRGTQTTRGMGTQESQESQESQAAQGMQGTRRGGSEPNPGRLSPSERDGGGPLAERKAAPIGDLRDRPTVDIRNGCRRVRMAEDMARWMRQASFDVMEYRSADRYDYMRTVIKERGNKPEATRKVGQWLRREFGVGEIQEDPNLTTAADVLIILGADLADTLRRRERAQILGPSSRPAE